MNNNQHTKMDGLRMWLSKRNVAEKESATQLAQVFPVKQNEKEEKLLRRAKI